MPGVAAFPGAGILERLELQPRSGQSDGAPVGEQQLTVHGDQVRHRAPLPDMPVQPEPAVHGVDHPVASLLVLPEGKRRWGRLVHAPPS